MTPWLAWLIAIACAGICLFLWFRDVRRIMRDRKSMVESAAGQLAICKKRSAEDQHNPVAAAVLERSESIYRQAVDLYHQSLQKLWVRLPAALMGFRMIPQEATSENLENREEDSAPHFSEEIPAEEEPEYFGSVLFFKHMILLMIVVMIAVPTALAIHSARNLQKTQHYLEAQALEIDALRQEKETLLKDTQQEKPIIREEIEIEEHHFWAESPYKELYPDFYAPQELSADVRETGVVYLTFDDGPSARTGEILDILKEKDVKATFFVIGSKDESSAQMLKRIVEEGHTLAMHSYSHNYSQIYASVEDYLEDMYQLFTYIQETTGETPSLFRFPGGSINGYNNAIYQELISEMLRRGFVPYDWNVSSEDAATNKLMPAEKLVTNVVTNTRKVQRGIVLMHDSAAKTTTVQALGPMIDGLREQGFELKELSPTVMPVLYGYKD